MCVAKQLGRDEIVDQNASTIPQRRRKRFEPAGVRNELSASALDLLRWAA
jgi:hypothetical protein